MKILSHNRSRKVVEYFFPAYLLQCDSTFAKQLFSTLFQAVFSQIEEKLPEREGVSVTSDVNKAINDMMSSSTQFFPPFISSVQVGTFFERKECCFSLE